MAIPDADKWNGNIHYYPDLLALAPARRALDVGCGEGILTRALAEHCDEVVGVDQDRPIINRAGSYDQPPNVRYVCEDVHSHYFAPGEFDLVVASATVHHLDLTEALTRMAELLAPGGRLGIIGLARTRTPIDVAWQVPRFLGNQYYQLVKGRRVWAQTAPTVWPPPTTFGQTRAIATNVLPGCTAKRRMLGRYTLTWTKPEEEATINLRSIQPASRTTISPSRR